jgi:periplasmic divalent cation tolerance protein
MQAMFVYITASSRQEALSIGRAVVGERLAACANVLDGMTSVYWWQQSLQEDGEASLILKTRSDLIERLTARVKQLHSYDCPCVVAMPIVAGNPAYLDWIAGETAAPAEA